MKQLSLFFKIAALTAIVVPVLWLVSLGRYQRAEHWLSNVYFAKEYRAKQIVGPKILIVAGSNALFGFDSATLGRLIKKPVVNFAGHASLPLDFHFRLVLTHVNAGDHVVMPLEFGYYAATPDVTTWEADNLSSWGIRYIDWQPATLFAYFRHSSFSSLLTRSLIRWLPTDTEAEVLARVAENSTAGIAPWRGYSYKSMNALGDILLHSMPPFPIPNTGYTTGEISDYAISRLLQFRAQLIERGAKLDLTWPVTMKNPLFDLEREKDRDVLQSIRTRLQSAGLSVICNPASFHFDRSLFLDTNYHANAEAALLRSERLAACIQETSRDRAE